MTLQKKKKLLSRVSLSVLLTVSTALHAELSDKATLSTYQGANGPWKYIEYLLIVKPKNELNYFINHAFGALGGAGVLFLAHSYWATPAKKETEEQKNSTFHNIALIASAVAAGKTAYSYFSCYAQRNIHKKTLSNFLKKWDTHRPYVPTAVVECFDELALMYQSKGDAMLTSELVAEVFELVQHHIEHHFAERYKPAEKKHIDPIENFKNLTEVWKNLG